MSLFIGIAIIAAFVTAILLFVIKSSDSDLEPDTTISEQEIHAELTGSISEEPTNQTPPIVVIEPPVASVAPVIEEPTAADEKPSVIAAAKKKPAAKKKTKKDA